jgi:hypothetical protein
MSQIGELKFKSKKAAEEYARQIINNIGFGDIKKDNEHYKFFENLIKNHHRYEEVVGCGIDYFYIQPNPLNRKQCQTAIKRIDNSDIVFSWRDCSTKKISTENEYLIDALRNSIRYQTIEFKKNNKLICNICQTEDETYKNYHIDHKYPSFKQLREDFIKITKHKIPTSFIKCEKYYLKIFKEEDKEFEDEWLDYHKKNCDLQVLCQKCNLKKH